MTTSQQWKNELWAFFETRSRETRSRTISLEDLCYISGREPRIWTDPAVLDDLMRSLQAQLDLQPGHVLLEVGCAAGFLARGLSPMVSRYMGVDLSAEALAVARRLGVPRSSYVGGDGTGLPFRTDSIDRVICHDVFTNIPEWDVAGRIIAEMIRITAPGGRAMVGSVPDEETQEAFQERAYEVVRLLDERFGPVAPPTAKRGLWARIRDRIWPVEKTSYEPRIVCYYFKKSDFLALGDKLGVRTSIHEIHQANPYAGFRYNVVYQLPA